MMFQDRVVSIQIHLLYVFSLCVIHVTDMSILRCGVRFGVRGSISFGFGNSLYFRMLRPLNAD